MKITILDKEGKKTKEIGTKLFEEPIREDIIRKVVEAERIWQPYSTNYLAGMNRSASGLIRKKRHAWKSDRGRGLSRIPRKIFWRRGTQFSWEGAIIPFARGGRRAHPPKGSVNLKKINKKEYKKAMLSALSYISNIKELKKKYRSMKDKEIKTYPPLIIEGKFLDLDKREFLKSLKKILGDFYDVSIKRKTIRAGIGKMRARKYKKNAGLLVVTGKNEDKKIKGIEIKKSDELTVSDLASNGARLTLFTENAIKELEDFAEGKKERKVKEKEIKNSERKIGKMRNRNIKKEKKKNNDNLLKDNKAFSKSVGDNQFNENGLRPIEFEDIDIKDKNQRAKENA